MDVYAGLVAVFSLNESPSKKEGKSACTRLVRGLYVFALNESPSKKEGKFR